MECQHEGGQCEFFVLCWMTGGLLQGTCNGMLQGCCHRTAKSSNLGPEAGKTFDLTDLPSTDYGPVVNDNSECIKKLSIYSLFCKFLFVLLTKSLMLIFLISCINPLDLYMWKFLSSFLYIS